MFTELDLDYLIELAKTDPEEFERFRAAEIEKIIQGASPENRKRLRGLQFQIDAKNRIHKDSIMGGCIELSKMMHESFEKLRFSLNQHFNPEHPLTNPIESKPVDNGENTSATVLSFRSEA